MKNNNVWLKAASVVLAVALWMFVISMGQSEVTLEVPLEFSNVQPGLRATAGRQRTVAISLKGHERFIKNLKAGDVKVVMDMAGLGEGRHPSHITGPNVSAPSPLRVVGIKPVSVNVLVESTLAKSVPVRPAVTGSPERGFEIVSVTATPAEIRVEGIKSELAELKALETEPVIAAYASESFSEEARIEKGGRDIAVSPEVVQVMVTIERIQK